MFTLSSVDPHDRIVMRVRTPAYICRPVDQYGKVTRCFYATAAFLDAVIEREVINRLSPVTTRAALDALKETVATHGKIQESHERQLQLAEARVTEARRKYETVLPEHSLVKVDLERRYNDALRAQHDLKVRLKETSPRNQWLPSPADAAELVRLAADVPALWHAPTTTPADRKELVRILISRVVVHDKTDAGIELEICWADGPTQRVTAYGRDGLESIIAELLDAGVRKADDITQALRARRLTNAFGQPITKNVVLKLLRRRGLSREHERQWIEGLTIISKLIALRKSPRQISAHLKSISAQHPLGEWTMNRVHNAIRRIRLNTVPAEVPPLPNGAEVTPSVHTSSAARELITRGRSSHPRRPWPDIVTELNSRGLQTATGKPFTLPLARSLFSRWSRLMRPPRSQ